MDLIYQYYVEGENERRLVEVLSKKFNYIKPGKIEVFNMVEKSIKLEHTRKLKNNTVVILVFDTDTNNIKILDSNIKFLRSCINIREVLCIPQVPKLEEELVRSCNIKRIEQFLGSSSKTEFKSDFNRCTGLAERFIEVGFDFNKIWRKKPEGVFSKIESGLDKITIKDNSRVKRR